MCLLGTERIDDLRGKRSTAAVILSSVYLDIVNFAQIYHYKKNSCKPPREVHILEEAGLGTARD